MWKIIFSLFFLVIGQLSWSANNASSEVQNPEVRVAENSTKQQKIKQDDKDKQIIYLLIACGVLASLSLMLFILLILQNKSNKKTLSLGTAQTARNSQNKRVSTGFEKRKTDSNMTNAQDEDFKTSTSSSQLQDNNELRQKSAIFENRTQSPQPINQLAELSLQDEYSPEQVVQANSDKKLSSNMNNSAVDPNDAAVTYIQAGNWRIFGYSAQGKDHLKMNPIVPCQDNHFIQSVDDGWGVAVVCDGAGSHKYSHIGSRFVTRFVADQVCHGVRNSTFYQKQNLPSPETWRKWCKALVWQTRQALEQFVKSQQAQIADISIGNVGCTLIVTVYSPYGILSAHIGDGRAGYRNAVEWDSIMTPFNGEYSNQTIFLNSDYIYQHELENPNEPERPFLETRVISGNVKSFVLMSDGCENGLYYVDKYDEVSKKVIDVNRPIDGFDAIIEMLSDRLKVNQNEATALFADIVNKGNAPLVEEGDDKTLVLGFLV